MRMLREDWRKKSVMLGFGVGVVIIEGELEE
jgi:hypothetical protein